jgi:hypothetical protein
MITIKAGTITTRGYVTFGANSTPAIPPFGDHPTLATSLTAYYKLDETSGTTMIDETGGANGTITTMTVNQTGLINQSYLNDTGYVDLAPSWITNTNQAFSVNFWVKIVTNSTFQRIVDYGPGNDFLFQKTNGNQIRFTNGTTDINTTATLTDTVSWHMLTLTGDTSVYDIYIDGVNQALSGTDTVTSNAIDTGTYQMVFGNQVQFMLEPFKGYLDEFGLWTKALSQTEIDDLYNSGTGLSY